MKFSFSEHQIEAIALRGRERVDLNSDNLKTMQQYVFQFLNHANIRIGRGDRWTRHGISAGSRKPE